ncbi:MAG: hypothetical protein Q9168_003127 [Polycauliona sp. 1 TL-2023]
MATKGFFDFPLEIREQIYAHSSPSLAVLYVTLGKASVRECFRTKFLRWKTGYKTKSLSILQLSKRVQTEALVVLYRTSTFAIRPYLSVGRPVLCPQRMDIWSTRWRKYPARIAIQGIRNWLVDLEMDLFQTNITQPMDYLPVLREIAATLRDGGQQIDKLTIKIGCPCTLTQKGFQTDKITRRPSRITPSQGRTILQMLLAPLLQLPNVAEIALDRTVRREVEGGSNWTIQCAGFHKSRRRSRLHLQLEPEDAGSVGRCNVQLCQESTTLFDELKIEVSASKQSAVHVETGE